jgi:ferredoxin
MTADHQLAGELIVRVDKLRCAGSGMCAVTAPDDLALGPDSHAVALRPVTHASEALFEAVEMCPTEALSVRSKATNEPVEPAN